VTIRGLLARNTEELDGVLRALGGEYVLPEAGGDLLRDGAGVLPTGAGWPRACSPPVLADSGLDPGCVSPRTRARLDASRQRAICAHLSLFRCGTQPGGAASPLCLLGRSCNACMPCVCRCCCDAACNPCAVAARADAPTRRSRAMSVLVLCRISSSHARAGAL